MKSDCLARRLRSCAGHMREKGLDALLLTKPSNMFYLTGDGRLCAYAMVDRGGRVALGVPSTDVADVTGLAHFDHIVGFEDEVGMIHSIARHFEHFGIHTGSVGLEYTFLTQSMMAMLTHPHAKPEGVAVKDCTHILSEMRLVKEPEEIERIRAAAHVADAAMRAATEAVKVGVTESQVAAAAEHAMRHAGAEGFWRSYVASGRRTNIAHGLPTSRRLLAGDLVMIDLHPIRALFSEALHTLSDILVAAIYSRKAADKEHMFGHGRAQNIELRPDYPFAYNSQGDAYMASGQPDQAISDFDRAIALQPDSPQAYTNRGNAYLRIGRLCLALADSNLTGDRPFGVVALLCGVPSAMILVAASVAYGIKRRRRLQA